jgi:hypothetical protein
MEESNLFFMFADNLIKGREEWKKLSDNLLPSFILLDL